MPLNTGQILNQRYRIVKLLGQGGFGAVYRAWDLNLKRAFALKENLDLSPESVRQFEREASFLADLHHPNLPRVIDCFNIPGQGQYLVMDYIEGETLEEKQNRAGGRLPESQVTPWFVQVCEALTYLHTQNPPVIHRDIKPANIKITPEGKAVLVDFGIAKAYYGSMQTTLGARAVTEGYSPPEQYGHGVTDARSDVYALGATLYHVLTGLAPVESVQRHLGADLLPPRRVNPSISRAAEAAILKALEVDMTARFHSVAGFKDALSSPAPVMPPPGAAVFGGGAFDDTLISLPQPVVAKPPKVKKVSDDKSRKGMLIGAAVGAVICAAVITVGVLGGWFVTLKDTPTPTAEAISHTTTAPTGTTPPTLTPTPTLVPLNPTPTPLPLTPTPSPLTPTLTPTPTEEPPTPTMTPSWTPTLAEGEWMPCPNTYPSRLHVDGRAYVSYYPPERNRVRSSPGLSSPMVGFLEPGEKVKIREGPVCADLMIWWEVKSLITNLNGWTSEGDLENYWLVPYE